MVIFQIRKLRHKKLSSRLKLMELVSGRAGILNLDSLTAESVSLTIELDCVVHRILRINWDKYLKYQVWCLAHSRHSVNGRCYHQSWEACSHVDMWKMWPLIRPLSDMSLPADLGFAQCQGFFQPSFVRQLIGKSLVPAILKLPDRPGKEHTGAETGLP